MSCYIGIWVDHKKAVFVTLENDETTVQTILSGVGRHVRLSGGARSRTPYGPQDIVTDGQRDARYRKHLVEFYRSLIERFGDAEGVYLFGPGEAKNELRGEIEKVKRFRGFIAGVETTDKMTDRQISAAVQSFFRERRPRVEPT